MLTKLTKDTVKNLTVIEMTCFYEKPVFSHSCYLVIVSLLALLLSQAWSYDSKFIPGCSDNKIVAVMANTMAKQMTIRDCVLPSVCLPFHAPHR